MPDLRDGAGAEGHTADGRPLGRVCGLPPPVLGVSGPHGPPLHRRDGTASVPAASGDHLRLVAGLDRARPRDTRRSLGRGAVLRARSGVDALGQSEHVHSDRHRDRGGVALLRRRDRRPRYLPGAVSRTVRRGRRLLRSGGGHRHARSSRSASGVARARADGRRDPGASGSGAEDRTSSPRWRGTGDPARHGAFGRSATRTAGRGRSRRWQPDGR